MRDDQCNGCERECPFFATAALAAPAMKRGSPVQSSEVLQCPLCSQWTRLYLTEADGEDHESSLRG